MTFLRLFYNLCFPVVLVMMLPSILLRMVRRGNYRHKFGQRFGMYSRRVLDKLSGHRWTWVHAVSVGEVMIALKLIEAVRERQPDLRVVLSTTTSTGYRLAHRRKSPFLEPIYTPLDIPGVVARALNAAQPDRLILVEAEVWPNMMAAAKKRGLPVILINARLSPRATHAHHVLQLAGHGRDPFRVMLKVGLAVFIDAEVDDRRVQATGQRAKCVVDALLARGVHLANGGERPDDVLILQRLRQILDVLLADPQDDVLRVES